MPLIYIFFLLLVFFNVFLYDFFLIGSLYTKKRMKSNEKKITILNLTFWFFFFCCCFYHFKSNIIYLSIDNNNNNFFSFQSILFVLFQDEIYFNVCLLLLFSCCCSFDLVDFIFFRLNIKRCDGTTQFHGISWMT